MAGVLGFEPRMAVPKTAALPLGYTPKIISNITKKKLYIDFDKFITDSTFEPLIQEILGNI